MTSTHRTGPIARARRRDDAPHDAYDCRTCGACCVPEVPLPFYVAVRAADLARLDRRWRERNVARGSLLTKLDPAGHCVCVALRGTVGRRCSCAIYERRPDECRRLEAASEECRKARRQAGLDEDRGAPAASRILSARGRTT